MPESCRKFESVGTVLERGCATAEGGALAYCIFKESRCKQRLFGGGAIKTGGAKAAL
jgi:hypothetical protein